VVRQAFGCSRCGSLAAAGQRFCGGCGLPLSANCPRCGTYVSPVDRFCENCGSAIGAAIPQQPGNIQQQPGWGQQQYPYTQPSPMTQPGYVAPASYQAQAAVQALPKGKLSVASLLLLIASIMLIVSPSLVWFRSQTTVFGMRMPSIAVKGSELGDVSSLLSMVGTSLLARGEYIIVLGALALILTIVSFFVLKGRRSIAAIIGIAAVICLLIGIEATLKLMDKSTSLGEGIFLMAGSSLILLIGSFKLP